MFRPLSVPAIAYPGERDCIEVEVFLKFAQDFIADTAVAAQVESDLPLDVEKLARNIQVARIWLRALPSESLGPHFKPVQAVPIAERGRRRIP